MVTPTQVYLAGDYGVSGRTCWGLPETRVSDEVVFGGEARGGNARAYAELAVDRVEVPVDGVGAYEELSGYLAVGPPVRHQPQHLDLARAQSGGMCRWGGRLHWLEGVSDGPLHLHRPSLRPRRPEGLLVQTGTQRIHHAPVIGAVLRVRVQRVAGGFEQRL